MKRAATAIVLIPAVVWVALYSPWIVWFSITAAVASLAFAEFRNIAAGHGSDFPLLPSLLAGIAILAAPTSIAFALPVIVVIGALCFSLRSNDLARVLPNCAGLLLGLFYVFGSWRLSLSLGEIDRHWLLFAMALNWVGDIGAYFVGRAIGKHRLAPVVSPKKSWEGAIASVILSAGFGILYIRQFIPGIPVWEAISLTAIANIAGQFGDLSESALKRGAGMKDSGSSLPGHGGWLDRIDSTLFAMPIVFLWITVRALVR